jgi:hypothetical protein
MKLSAEQIEKIREVINQSTISIQPLKDDLVDHLCCVVESEMGAGKAFEVSLVTAVQELAPEGFERIQHETIFLLNSTKILLMKKVMYTIGLLSAMTFVLGWVFGVFHWPGTTLLSFLGFSGFAFIFLPMLAIDYYKVKIQRAVSEKLKFIIGLASAMLVGLSGLFKVLHVQWAPFLLIAGAGLFIFGFLPFLFFTLYKKSIS